MPKYTVYVKEVWIQPVEIEAPNAEAAKRLVYQGEGLAIEDQFRFSDCLDSGLWMVEEVKEVSECSED